MDTISTHILDGAAAHLLQPPFLLPVAEGRGNADRRYGEAKPAPIGRIAKNRATGERESGSLLSSKSGVAFHPGRLSLQRQLQTE